jgi:hypothetical protein
MKYMMTFSEFFKIKNYNITTTSDDEVFTSFPAEIGNPNYDAFLTQAELTDKQVHALKPDVWYDFPNGDK